MKKFLLPVAVSMDVRSYNPLPLGGTLRPRTITHFVQLTSRDVMGSYSKEWSP